MSRILWVLPKWTLPVNDGARVATDSLVRNVVGAGAEVDVFSFYDHTEVVNIEELRARWQVKDVVTHKKLVPVTSWGKKFFYLKKLLSEPGCPLTFSIFRDPAARQALQAILAKGKYDYVVLEGLHLAVTIWDDKKASYNSHGAKVIVRAHNVECELWQKAASDANLFKKMFLTWQYKLVLRLEQLLLSSAQGVAAISREDEAIFSRWGVPHLKCIPLGLNFTRPLDFNSIEVEQFLFIGRLDWMPNRQGLEWLLEKVWPQVIKRRSTAQLKIVGVGDNSWLKRYLPLHGVELVGKVADVRTAYASAAFCVAPIFFGSGTRIKIVEAFAMNRRLISTAMGVQGAEVVGDMYENAESIDAWIEKLVTIKWDQSQAELLNKARHKMQQHFDEVVIGRSAYDWIKSI